MCLTSTISHQIDRTSRFTYDQRIVLFNEELSEQKLVLKFNQLFRKLDRVAEQLHASFGEISREKAPMLLRSLDLLIETIRSLSRQCAVSELEKFRGHLDSCDGEFQELRDDIDNFKVKLLADEGSLAVLGELSRLATKS